MRISDWSSDVCSSDIFDLSAGLNAKLALRHDDVARLQATGDNDTVTDTPAGRDRDSLGLATGAPIAATHDRNAIPRSRGLNSGCRNHKCAMLRWKIQRRGDIHARAQGMIGIGNHRLHRHIASVLANPGLDRIDMAREAAFRPGIDRKSTRLNSSH